MVRSCGVLNGSARNLPLCTTLMLPADLETTAAHLRRLGCCEHQVQLHLRRLQTIERARAARTKRAPKPRRSQDPKPPRRPRGLSDEHVRTILDRLRAGTWSRYGRGLQTPRWAGVVVQQVLGLPPTERLTASRVLCYLDQLGFTKPISPTGNHTTIGLQVLSAPPPAFVRTRLQPPHRATLDTTPFGHPHF
jgi:hypothetical protein